MIILKLLFSFLLFFSNLSTINNDIDNLNLSSERYLLYSVDTNKIIAKKESDIAVSMGSVNKILTTITLLELLADTDLDTEIIVTQSVLNHVSPVASIAGLYAGQKISLKELMFGIMLPSGADSIVVLSHYLYGDTATLAKKMNEKAKSLNLVNTNIVNPFGLDDYNQYTTLEDVLTILTYALKNPIFYELYTTMDYKLKNDNRVYTNQILKSGEILNFDFFVGAKSGYTYAAKRSLSSLAKINDQTYILITNRANGGGYLDNGAMLDAIKVYNYIYENYENKTFEYKPEEKSIKIKKKEYDILIKPYESIDVVAYNDFSVDDLVFVEEFDEELSLPIKVDDIIGTRKTFYQDELYKTEYIISDQEIKKNHLPLYILSVMILLIILILFKHFYLKTLNN